jgi:hypothetical protein
MQSWRFCFYFAVFRSHWFIRDKQKKNASPGKSTPGKLLVKNDVAAAVAVALSYDATVIIQLQLLLLELFNKHLFNNKHRTRKPNEVWVPVEVCMADAGTFTLNQGFVALHPVYSGCYACPHLRTFNSI